MSEIIRMPESEIEKAGGVLSRAFCNDRISQFMSSDETERRNLLEWYFTAFARYGHLFGEAYVTKGETRGVAIWFPPGESEMPAERIEHAGLDKAPQVFGADAWSRFTTLMDQLDRSHVEDMKTPHWFLPLLGIDPPYQHSGLGSNLLAPMLSRADADGLPCYLATAEPRNIQFYQKQGFAVINEGVEPQSGIKFWTFRREPLSGV